MFGKNKNVKKRNFLEEPKIGEIVVTDIRDIQGIKIIRGVDEKLQFYHIRHLEGQGRITLLKYEGNGIFTEYYTQKRVLFIPIEGLEEFTSFTKKYRFSRYKDMNDIALNQYFSENCVIVTDFRKIYDMDKEQMGKQEVSRDSLISLMNEFFDNAQFEFENKREQFLNGEQIIEDFGKGVTRKLENNTTCRK